MKILTAMISSTAIDLPEHRKQAMEACLREEVMPIAMEYLPALDADAVRVSLEMVEKADIYIGIYAWRYGHIPAGQPYSITEMEYNRAVERKIPILVFLSHKDHHLPEGAFENDDRAQEKLAVLKRRASERRIRMQFQSPTDLRSHIIQSLSWLLRNGRLAEGKVGSTLHATSVVPFAPIPFIAQPYSLLQTKDVVGRAPEMGFLTDWFSRFDDRVVILAAIGGMGKSALTWKWFNEVAPKAGKVLCGSLWWSFYESDAHYENFINRALRYTAGISEREILDVEFPTREEMLLSCLNSRLFLIVLDGFERLLIAYSRLDRAHISDDELEQTSPSMVEQSDGGVIGEPDLLRSQRRRTENADRLATAGRLFADEHQLRQCCDPRVGRFLRRLSKLHASRVIISTRLVPAELETETGVPLPGCIVKPLTGLSENDAVSLWREFGLSGSREQLLPLFNSFGNYPLVLRALAGEIARFRPAPGDFGKWRLANPTFNPAALNLTNAKTHVLEFSLRGLSGRALATLHSIAAFRMPAMWETLCELHRARSKVDDHKRLDAILVELEDRGLIGWDKRTNRYDMHPIVRNVVWRGLKGRTKKGVLSKLHSYFAQLPHNEDWRGIRCIDDITAEVELYSTLIGLERYSEAWQVFHKHLDSVTDYRFCASRLRIELLTPLAQLTELGTPRVGEPSDLLAVLHSLGRAWFFAGSPAQAIAYYNNALCLGEQSPLLPGPDSECLADLSGSLRVSGRLFEAEFAARHAIAVQREHGGYFQEGGSCVSLSLALSARGEAREAHLAAARAVRIAEMRNGNHSKIFAYVAIAQMYLWTGQPAAALGICDELTALVRDPSYERDIIRVARLHGSALLRANAFKRAKERLHFALGRARDVNYVEEELRCIVELAELGRRNGESQIAREFLEQVCIPAETRHYRLIHADARNVLARIERDSGNRQPAIDAAIQAYELAWCDGPPFAFNCALVFAKRVLTDFAAPEPQLPLFDITQRGTMPDIQINPKDSFYIDPDKVPGS